MNRFLPFVAALLLTGLAAFLVPSLCANYLANLPDPRPVPLAVSCPRPILVLPGRGTWIWFPDGWRPIYTQQTITASWG